MTWNHWWRGRLESGSVLQTANWEPSFSFIPSIRIPCSIAVSSLTIMVRYDSNQTASVVNTLLECKVKKWKYKHGVFMCYKVTVWGAAARRQCHSDPGVIQPDSELQEAWVTNHYILLHALDKGHPCTCCVVFKGAWAWVFTQLCVSRGNCIVMYHVVVRIQCASGERE